VVPLGPQSSSADETHALAPRIPARDSTGADLVPWVVTLGFASALAVVILTGGVLVLWRLRKR
jgi:hypothetical protein